MDQLIQYWLSTLCNSVQGVNRAVVLTFDGDDNHYKAVATLPENIKNYGDLEKIASLVQDKGKIVFQHDADRTGEAGAPLDIVASPLFVETTPFGVVVVQMSTRVSEKQRITLQQIEGAAAWFGAMLKQRSQAGKSQLVTIVELVASCLEHESFQVAAVQVMTELTTIFSWDRVSLGLNNGRNILVKAISHNADFDHRSNLIRDIGEAMFEAVDQDLPISYPKTKEDFYSVRCHKHLGEKHNVKHILTVPFMSGGKVAGAVLAESSSEEPVDPIQIEHFEHVVSMIGPILEVRYRNEEWLPARANLTLKKYLSKIFGAGHLGFKLGIAAALFFLLFFSFATGDYRVAGNARLEARTQRVIVAPQDGFIAESHVRPGDIIHSGDVIGSLDDRDLKLEHQKWASQFEQLQREYRDALAQHDRSKVSILNARKQKAEAQLNLVREKLIRSRFTAPFNGIIVSGDLSQALGSPVERGQVMFTVAPLVAYRVILLIDERDIGAVIVEQQGELVLSSMPRTPLRFTVEKITPVSVLEDGRNYFQVEAKIKDNSDLLRPGMEGVAKIVVEKRKLIWIWTHRLIDWLSLSSWAIRP